MKRVKLGVSACLLGVNCKYNGGNNLDFDVLDFVKGKELVLICPEEMSGLPTPRVPNEIQTKGTVINKDNVDMTFYFNKGKKLALQKLKENNCTEVILKDGSPSCGHTYIYDGNFTNTMIKGQGLTAQYLQKNNINIIKLK
ncbi:MAG: DUF523 domain-containing protein [Candidatus Izimaplasma sp.]|nr:DUF523 domain-containing protein [Candidatus Izimaplasma bacterium]